jgi:hypothetical protein
MAAAAAGNRIAYIDPMNPTPWFPTGELPDLINATARNHPSASGYRVFATDFDNAFRALLSGSPTSAADARSG